jgi:hypothetical protein
MSEAAGQGRALDRATLAWHHNRLIWKGIALRAILVKTVRLVLG